MHRVSFSVIHRENVGQNAQSRGAGKCGSAADGKYNPSGKQY